MSKKKRELPEWDDGRTIVPMNVEGMPWSGPKSHWGSKNARNPGSLRQKEAGGPAAGEGQTTHPAETLTREESRYYTWGALKAALAVIGVMCAGLVLFILFCQFVWFR